MCEKIVTSSVVVFEAAIG